MDLFFQVFSIPYPNISSHIWEFIASAIYKYKYCPGGRKEPIKEVIDFNKFLDNWKPAPSKIIELR